MVQGWKNHRKIIDGNGALEKKHYHSIVMIKWPSSKSTGASGEVLTVVLHEGRDWDQGGQSGQGGQGRGGMIHHRKLRIAFCPFPPPQILYETGPTLTFYPLLLISTQHYYSEKHQSTVSQTLCWFCVICSWPCQLNAVSEECVQMSVIAWCEFSNSWFGKSSWWLS